MSSEAPVEIDVAIIGAGWYGLKAARTYLDLEPGARLVVFEGDDSVGGVWSKKRIYHSLVAQVEFGYFNYPGHPMSRDGKPENNLVSGDMIQRYLEKFAVDNDLMRRIRFNSWVDKVERCPRGWRLRVNGRYIESAKLILATVVTSVPNENPFQVEAGATVIHSRDIAQNLPVLKEVESVVVVGGAKLAYDAAYLLCSIGKRVTWVIRPDGSGPMPLMPHQIGGMNTITVGSTRLMTYLSPSMFNTTTALGSFFHRTALGRYLTKAHWSFMTGPSEKAAGFGGNAGPVEGLKPDMEDRSCFWCDSSLGLITVTDFWSTLKKGNVTILRDNVDVARRGSVLLRSGQVVGCDHVLNATGWGGHFNFFSSELKEELGLPAYGAVSSETDEKSDFWEKHDKAAAEVVSKSLPLLAKGPQNVKPKPNRMPTKRRWRLYNRWAAAYLLGEVDLPDEQTMIKEIAEYLAWVRMRYSSVGERYPYALVDWIGYLDKLLGDLGIKSRRKGNFITDFFSPYGPQNYGNCLNEYMAKRP